MDKVDSGKLSRAVVKLTDDMKEMSKSLSGIDETLRSFKEREKRALYLRSYGSVESSNYPGFLLYGQPVTKICHEYLGNKHRLVIYVKSKYNNSIVSYPGNWATVNRVAVLGDFRAVDTDFISSLPEVFYAHNVESCKVGTSNVNFDDGGAKWRRFWSMVKSRFTNHRGA